MVEEPDQYGFFCVTEGELRYFFIHRLYILGCKCFMLPLSGGTDAVKDRMQLTIARMPAQAEIVTLEVWKPEGEDLTVMSPSVWATRLCSTG